VCYNMCVFELNSTNLLLKSNKSVHNIFYFIDLGIAIKLEKRSSATNPSEI